MSQRENAFDYNIRRNGTLLVLMLSGVLQENNCSKLDKVADEVRALSESRFVLFELSQIENITMGAVPSFVKLQKLLRDSGIQIRICATPDALKAKLSRMGVIRNAEIAATLKVAIDWITQIGRARAA